jgi:beta-lactamase class A
MTAHDSSKLMRTKMEARLRELADETRGALGLAVLDLTNAEVFGVNEQLAFPQASAIKIPILMEVYKQAGEGKFRLSDVRCIEKQDKTGGSGVLHELGDGTVRLTIHDLCILMILVSDNTATNLLLDLVGMESINQTLKALGMSQTRVRRRMMDLAASARGEENLSSPAEAVRIMDLLYRGEFVSRPVCEEILAILKKPKTGGIVSGLPEGVLVASKPGGIAGVTTEWAIVFLPGRPYALAIMENYGMGREARDAMKEISKTLYDYFLRLSRSTPHGVYVSAPGQN